MVRRTFRITIVYCLSYSVFPNVQRLRRNQIFLYVRSAIVDVWYTVYEQAAARYINYGTTTIVARAEGQRELMSEWSVDMDRMWRMMDDLMMT